MALAPRAPCLRLAVPVPLELEIRVDVAGLGRGDEQAVLVDNEVRPRGVRRRVSGVEDEKPRQDAEVLAIPEAWCELWVACHLADAAELRRQVGRQTCVLSTRAPEELTHLRQRRPAAELIGPLLGKIALEATQKRDLGAALAFDLPLSLTAHGHDPLTLEHLVQVKLHLVRITVRTQTLPCELRLVVKELADCGLPRAHAGEKYACARLRELLRRDLLDLDAKLTFDATLRVGVPRAHVGRRRRACAIASGSCLCPAAYLSLTHWATAQRHLYNERHAVVLLSLSEDLQAGGGCAALRQPRFRL